MGYKGMHKDFSGELSWKTSTYNIEDNAETELRVIGCEIGW